MQPHHLKLGTALVLLLLTMLALGWFFINWNRTPTSVPVPPHATVAATSPTLLLPPPTFATKPVVRAVISTYKPKPAVIKFSGIKPGFTGTWAAYRGLCDTASYDIQPKTIRIAGAGRCDLRGMQSAASQPSATLVLDCHHDGYHGQEVWNLSQPRPGALTLRRFDENGGGNAVSLIRCIPNQLVAYSR